MHDVTSQGREFNAVSAFETHPCSGLLPLDDQKQTAFYRSKVAPARAESEGSLEHASASHLAAVSHAPLCHCRAGNHTRPSFSSHSDLLVNPSGPVPSHKTCPSCIATISRQTQPRATSPQVDLGREIRTWRESGILSASIPATQRPLPLAGGSHAVRSWPDVPPSPTHFLHNRRERPQE